MITRAHVMPYLGQAVEVRTHDGGVHRGVLHSARTDGIYLRRGAGARLAAGSDAMMPKFRDDGLISVSDQEVELAWWPFFFIPFAAMAAFGPWGLWW